ncbi:MAG: type II CRISPR RNA-guided endonuclease Cas9 [Bacteroidales bacterium]|nr:type II CRISPR RNA-guided endonuclease Cas9 [Bacteroidales bacterium]
MKKILGLDLGTNSIGWALISENEAKKEIIGMGSRIIPMSQDILGEFDRGNSVSQTAERTGFRGVRRLRERHLLRRERLHRVLNIMGFLPRHYAESIDFEKNLGQFIDDSEPKLVYRINPITNRVEFIFQESFNEMMADFRKNQPRLLEKNKKIPYDWTIYYLRKKALTSRIEKEELGWLLLNFNQKRGYYQLRGEDEEEQQNKTVEFYSLKVIDVIDSGDKKGNNDIWYNVVLENGWIYRRTSKTPLDWKGKIKDFIVTTDIDENGNVKTDKEGKEKRSFRAPLEDDWTLIKKKTEADIDKSHKTVGSYIYETMLLNPTQKIKGKLVRTIERKFYKEELRQILEKQKEFHSELNDSTLYSACLEELYEFNDAHKNSIRGKDFTHLFLNDIIFYQRPLKTKKSLISNCQYETRTFIKDGKKEVEPLKCIAKSHSLFQEFRLWQFIHNLKIYVREKVVNGKIETDVNITNEFLKTDDDWVNLFDWLNGRKEIDQKAFLKYFKLKIETHRWNYIDDKENKKSYPCNETHFQIASRLAKVENLPDDFLTKEVEESLWHILYSVEDKKDIEKALKTFAVKHGLNEDFVEGFKKFPRIEKEYGSYSSKAIKKLLSLMRMGKYWNEESIPFEIKSRIELIVERLKSVDYIESKIDSIADDDIPKQILKSFVKCNNHYSGLNTYQACYAVYGRHSESGEIRNWETPADIEQYLREEFKQHSLRNPIVEQVITETLRVVKDIWKHYGNSEKNFFKEIHIELGREMKNPADKRKTMTNQMSENENTNLRIKAMLVELFNDGNIENVRPYSPNQQEILKLYEEGVLNAETDIPEDILKISKKSQPSKVEIERYKLWLAQRYCSPYTGEMIPLSKLFTTAYQIEHIIPQSRYFDDSLSNKVICEAEVNKDKDNSLAYEYIKNNSGKKIELSYGKEVTLFTLAAYEEHVKRSFSTSRGKMKKLLMEDIPETFINRQLNDSRYISKVVKGLLSNIVRTEDELESTSKNVLSSNGNITSILKQDWGLNDVWNNVITPRFERLNKLTGSNNFGQWTSKEGKQVFQTQVPLELQKGFVKKRIDHRHHAMDALVIACATRNHINYLNNEHARQKEDKTRFELRNMLRRIEEIEVDRIENGQKIRKKIKVAKEFHKPWKTFTQDAQSVLEGIVVSFKQNLRVINKSVNHYQKFVDGKKVLEKQIKGDSWAIRKPMHKDTVSGSVTLRFKKMVQLTVAIDSVEMIVDKSLRAKVKELLVQNNDKKKIVKFFKDIEYKWNDKDISRVEIYYLDNGNVASRVKVDESFNGEKIGNITDTGIQKIMLNHLNQEKYQNQLDESGKSILPETLAFSADGLDDLNANIVKLNNNKSHQPILKVRTFEPKGNKFNVGVTGNKRDKFVEAAKGTNLFFAVYQDKSSKRNYESIQLNHVIELQKQGFMPVPELNEKGDKLLFYLSPNDLVYVPNEEEQENPHLVNFSKLQEEQVSKVYKMVSCSGNQCFFIRNNIANSIVNKVEFSALNKMEKSIEGTMIKEFCWKLKVDRLGNITEVNGKPIL